jgi:hypothetical protein
MERQCRICLDTEHPHSMISPCMCSGTSAYIHEACLLRYFDYFPDRICRVCHAVMAGRETFYVADRIVFRSMSLWMMFLLCLSSVENRFKILYLLLLVAVSFLTNSIRGIIGLVLTGLSIVFALVTPEISVQLIVLLGVLGTFGVMCLYIPMDVMLVFVSILLCGTYTIFITMFFAMNQDSYLNAFFVPFILLLWVCVIRARPPLRM